jgi:hypothetical protein
MTTEATGELLQRDPLRDVAAVLEERVPEREAHPLPTWRSVR